MVTTTKTKTTCFQNGEKYDFGNGGKDYPKIIGLLLIFVVYYRCEVKI